MTTPVDPVSTTNSSGCEVPNNEGPSTPTKTSTNETTTTTTTKEEKKKNTLASPPVPCPSSVTTAYLVLRGAVGAVFGTAMVSIPQQQQQQSTNHVVGVNVSIMQALYLKENRPSAKFTINDGKKGWRV